MSQESSLPQFGNNDEIDLLALFESLWEQKLVIAAITAVVTVLAIGYAFLATPYYETQSTLRPAAIKDLDEVNASGIYEITPEEALHRVGSALDSYETRLNYYRDNPELFSSLNKTERSLEQSFEAFNQRAFSVLRPDPRRNDNLASFVGLRMTYPRGIDGPAVVNGLVAYAIEGVRSQVETDIEVLTNNRLATLERRINAARASYEAEKEIRIAELTEADSLKRAQLQDELRALREELRQRRADRIAQLDEAIRIASALNIRRPTTPSALGQEVRTSGSVIRTEVTNQDIPLYFMGTDALEAERKALEARTSDDFTEPRIAEITKELQLLEHNRKIEVLSSRENDDLFLTELAEMRSERARLKSLQLNLEGLNLVRIDQWAITPLSTVKPKKALVVALGVVLGGVLGMGVALVRIAMRSRKTGAKPASEA